MSKHPWKEEVRKAKAQMEINLVGDIMDDKKGFFKYTGRRSRRPGKRRPGKI